MLKRSLLRAATLATWLAVAGCAIGGAKAPQERTLYERLGGKPAIAAVVEDAVGNIAADARINGRFHNAGIAHLTRNLIDLVCLRTGGPCTYTGRNMAGAHEGMNISEAEFTALAEDLMKSLDKFNVPAREQRELMAILGQMKNAIIEH